MAIGIAIGSGYLFPTTFEQEVYSDLTGERGVLMGALAGIMEAQYNVLREHGHIPAKLSMKRLKNLPRVLSDWLMKTVWIGCIPIAVLQLNEVHSTGDQNSGMPFCRFSKPFMRC